MIPITDIQTLIDRESAIDQTMLTGPLEDCCKTHPEVDVAAIGIPQIKDADSRGLVCDCCGCATVGIELEHSRQRVRVCREMIKCIKLKSLVSNNSNEVRLFERMRFIDGLPIMAKVEMSRLNASKQIAAGLMEWDGPDDSLLVIHDLVHLADQHCRGINCWSLRHPGCPRDTNDCSAFVPSPRVGE